MISKNSSQHGMSSSQSENSSTRLKLSKKPSETNYSVLTQTNDLEDGISNQNINKTETNTRVSLMQRGRGDSRTDS